MTGAVTPDHIASAARALVGTAFRLGGRDPATGLDCVGLVAFALNITAAPQGYAIRNTSIDRHLVFAARAGLLPAAGPILRGDVVLTVPGPAQHHLLVALGPEDFVHAHAGLRRVVLHHGPLPWPVRAHWRLLKQGS